MDYFIIKTYIKNHEKHHTIQCSKCGHIKEITDSNFKNNKLNCNGINCKEDFYNSFIGNKIGDYIVDSVNINKDICILHCDVCGTQEKIKIQSLLKATNKNHKHGLRCFKNLPSSDIKQAIAVRFNDIKQRCNNPNNHNFSHYGGRGIKCEYEYAVDLYYDFYDELLEHSKKYGLKNSTFYRIDVNGNYTKDNLRIATQSIQSTNTVRKRLFILRKNEEIVLCDNAMQFGKHFNVNGRSVGNVVRGDSKSAGGWVLVKTFDPSTDIDSIIKAESVTTKLITT